MSVRIRGIVFAALVILLVEVAFTGRIGDPFLVVWALVGSVGRSMVIGPKPREPGRWWGTIDQKIALEAQRETEALDHLRKGQQPRVSVPPQTLIRLGKLARSDLRLSLWASYLGMSLSLLGLVSFVVHVAHPDDQVIRLIALVVVVPLLGRLGYIGRGRSRTRLDALRSFPDAAEVPS